MSKRKQSSIFAAFSKSAKLDNDDVKRLRDMERAQEVTVTPISTLSHKVAEIDPNRDVRVPLSKHLKTKYGVHTHMLIEADVFYSMCCLNEGVDEKKFFEDNGKRYVPKNWKKVGAQAGKDGETLGYCMFRVSEKAIGVFKHLRGKMVKVHAAKMLFRGVIAPDTVLGNKGDNAINIDHKTHPADNRDENLRLVRNAINLMRKGGAQKVRKLKNGVRWEFNKPMVKYIRRRYSDKELSQDLKKFDYRKEGQHKTGYMDTSQSSKRSAQVRKAAVGNAVLDFLNDKEPEIFTAKHYACGRVLFFSMLPELRAAFVVPKKN